MVNIYCDESWYHNCGKNVMVLAAVICSDNFRKKVAAEIRDIKIKHNLSSYFEIKWRKISQGKNEFYKEVTDYLFNSEYLKFNAVIAEEKTERETYKFLITNCIEEILKNKEHYNKNTKEIIHIKNKKYSEEKTAYQDKYISENSNDNLHIKIFLNIKDTHGAERIKELKNILNNKQYIKGIYQINSKESELIQVSDLIAGAVSCFYREAYKKNKDTGKSDLIKYLCQKYKISINKEVLSKFVWTPQGGGKNG